MLRNDLEELLQIKTRKYVVTVKRTRLFYSSKNNQNINITFMFSKCLYWETYIYDMLSLNLVCIISREKRDTKKLHNNIFVDKSLNL